jgi:hypothetical protein
MFLRGLAVVIGAGLLTAAAPVGTLKYAPSQAWASSGTFRALEGVWRGAGKILLTDGQSQSIRCRAYYRVDESGSELGFAIRCAAPDNRIELRAKISDSGGRLSGSWEERTFNATGAIQGHAQPGMMDFWIDGAVTGSIKISYSRREQIVDISTAADGLRGVSIALSR